MSLVTGFPLEQDNLPYLWVPFKYEKKKKKFGKLLPCLWYAWAYMNKKYCSEIGVQLMMKKDLTCGIYTKWPKVDKWEAQIGSDWRNLGNLHRLDLVATYQRTGIMSI